MMMMMIMMMMMPLASLELRPLSKRHGASSGGG
jgi:hypothetical protein